LTIDGTGGLSRGAERFEIWSQDEARVGQDGRTGYVWWQRGQTPRGLRDVGCQSAWIIGAVCPARETGVALVMTRIDTAAMNLFLIELSQVVAPSAHGILLMDKAGCHTADELRVPENLSLGSCRPTHLSSTRSSGYGCICATIACPTASFRRPKRSSTPVARLGTGCSRKPGRIRSLCSYPWLKQVSS
jgi:hypothetical protein